MNAADHFSNFRSNSQFSYFRTIGPLFFKLLREQYFLFGGILLDLPNFHLDNQPKLLNLHTYLFRFLPTVRTHASHPFFFSNPKQYIKYNFQLTITTLYNVTIVTYFHASTPIMAVILVWRSLGEDFVLSGFNVSLDSVFEKILQTFSSSLHLLQMAFVYGA